MLGNPEIEAEGPYAVVLAPTRELAQQARAVHGVLGRYAEWALRLLGWLGLSAGVHSRKLAQQASEAWFVVLEGTVTPFHRLPAMACRTEQEASI